MVPNMGTYTESPGVAAALFGKTRRKVLALLYLNEDRSYYLREIIRELQLGRGSVQRELARLTDSGLVIRTVEGNQVRFSANRHSPVFPEIRSLMQKTEGAEGLLQSALSRLGDRISMAFVYGSSASGTERPASDVDLMVVGDITFGDMVEAVADTEQAIGREVNPSVYSTEEFRAKIASGHHFLGSVARGPVRMLLGDEDELRRMAAEGLADPP